jgi:group I intron endonuclease
LFIDYKSCTEYIYISKYSLVLEGLMAAAKKKIAVYRIENVVSGKYYIGSSGNLYERWRKHKNKLRAGTHPNPHLQGSWNKHGERCFVFSIVGEFEEIADMEQCEQGLIDTSINDPLCMNIARWIAAPMRGRTGTAHPNYGKPMAEEQKQKLRSATKLQWEESDPRTGRKHSAAARAKISAKVQAVVAAGGGGKFIPTAETRAKMSAANRGNQRAKGHVRTAEHRRKLSEANKGNTHWKGRTHSTESREKMGRAVIAVDPNGAEQTYGTISALRAALNMTPPTVDRALKSGRPLSKGARAGWSFRYA